MEQPVNYAIDVQTPFQAALQGYQAGAAIRNDQQQQEQLQLQQQSALQQQAQQQQAFQGLMSNPNPTAKDFADMSLLIPGLKDQIKQAWEMRNTDQQQNDLSHASQVYAALQSNQPDIAVQMLRDRAAALRNSGRSGEAQHAETTAAVAEEHPQLAKSMVGITLNAIPGGDKILDAASKMGAENRAAARAPADLRKAEADATSAEVTAGNAPTAAVLGNEAKAQEIRASQLQGDVARLNAQIAAANSETERGRLTLERDKLNVELQKLGQAQAISAQDSQNATTNALQTLQTIREHPGMTGWNKPGEWSGAMMKTLPTSERNDLENYVDALKGQLSYQNLMAMKAASPNGASGLGALSEGEMKMLSGISGALNTNSPNFPKQLTTVERFLQKAQSTTVARGNLPTTGEAFVMRHPVYGNVTEGQVNALMRQFPGSTRAQIIQFLQQSGGK